MIKLIDLREKLAATGTPEEIITGFEKALEEFSSDPQPLRYSRQALCAFEYFVNQQLGKQMEVLNPKQQLVDENAVEQFTGKGDWADQAFAHQSIAVANSCANSIALNARNLKQALALIQARTYGVCTETGVLINPWRLRACPATTKSIEAKSSLAVAF